MPEAVEVGRRRIGPGEPVYIVAEISANHGQSFEQAAELVRAAKACGADAVKLQTFTPDTLTIDCDGELFRIRGTPWDGRTLYDLYGEAYMPWDWQPRLKKIADGLGLDLFSTPFDASAVDFLEAMGVPAHKIASFENCDPALLCKAAATGKPLFVSTGMATLAEIDEMVRAVRGAGGAQLVLLKCTSAYPAPPEEMNLRTIPHLAEAFGAPVGLSDHTLGIAVPAAAVALGACVVEKHFTLSRAAGGPDSSFSLEPEEFKAMVEAIRVAEKALGWVHYGLSAGETQSRLFRRSLFVVRDVAAGERFTTENVRSIRPGHGLHPRHLPEILGRSATRDIRRGTPLSWKLVGGERNAAGEPARRRARAAG
ncbi:MAG TPA: pseudaminic acid synthase [candidate division Zixibacteria bacterium]|nr:pseudaminic acid synthase [candidate division Zixibacteria bacterium]